MKFICLLNCVLVALLLPFSALAQKDKIEGQWYTQERTSKIEIYQGADHKFYGRIVWLKEPNRIGRPKLDDYNTNKSLRNRALLGLVVLKGFVRKDDETYDDGEIYDPKNGKTYSCTITYRSDRELGVRGYIGISLIGRTSTFYRAD